MTDVDDNYWVASDYHTTALKASKAEKLFHRSLRHLRALATTSFPIYIPFMSAIAVILVVRAAESGRIIRSKGLDIGSKCPDAIMHAVSA